MSYTSEAVNAQAEGVTSATAVQRSSAGYKAPGQTAFTWTGTAFTTGSLTSLVLGSVATINSITGSTSPNFYLSDFYVATNFNNTSGNLDVQFQAGGVALIRTSTHNLTPADFINMETQPVASAGKTLALVIGSAASTNQYWYYVAGWFE